MNITSAEHSSYTLSERLVSALTLLLIIPFPIGGLLGIILFFSQRERSRFIAYHGLQAAIWQLCYAVLSLILITFAYITKSFNGVQFLISAPDNFQQIWAVTTPLEHLVILLTIFLPVLNILVALPGIIIVLCGKLYHMPVISTVSQKFYNPRPIDR